MKLKKKFVNVYYFLSNKKKLKKTNFFSKQENSIGKQERSRVIYTMTVVSSFKGLSAAKIEGYPRLADDRPRREAI